jgi:two-component system, chemotaxis family, chemotaxis protein CheY
MTTDTTGKASPARKQRKSRNQPKAQAALRLPDYPGTLSRIASANPDFRVLIVDDCRPTRMLVRSILNVCGVSNIKDAVDGAEALEVLDSSLPDLIISDVQMTPLDGIEFSRLIRNDPHSPNPRMPIVIMTGHTKEERIVALREAGLTDVVAKPLSPKMLCRSIVTALQKSDSGALVA